VKSIIFGTTTPRGADEIDKVLRAKRYLALKRCHVENVAEPEGLKGLKHFIRVKVKSLRRWMALNKLRIRLARHLDPVRIELRGQRAEGQVASLSAPARRRRTMMRDLPIVNLPACLNAWQDDPGMFDLFSRLNAVLPDEFDKVRPKGTRDRP